MHGHSDAMRSAGGFLVSGFGVGEVSCFVALGLVRRPQPCEQGKRFADLSGRSGLRVDAACGDGKNKHRDRTQDPEPESPHDALRDLSSTYPERIEHKRRDLTVTQLRIFSTK
jgi:hypothetical protein